MKRSYLPLQEGCLWTGPRLLEIGVTSLNSAHSAFSIYHFNQLTVLQFLIIIIPKTLVKLMGTEKRCFIINTFQMRYRESDLMTAEGAPLVNKAINPSSPIYGVNANSIADQPTAYTSVELPEKERKSTNFQAFMNTAKLFFGNGLGGVVKNLEYQTQGSLHRLCGNGFFENH